MVALKLTRSCDNRSKCQESEMMTYDPVPALRALRVPALFLFGAEDRLIPVERSAAVIREVQAQNEHADFTIQVFDHDDHGMYDSSGTLDPRYLDAMAKWLAAKIPARHF